MFELYNLLSIIIFFILHIVLFILGHILKSFNQI